jgi:hypothetical protein
VEQLIECTDQPVFDFQSGKKCFSLSAVSREALGPPQGDLYLALKLPEPESGNLFLFSRRRMHAFVQLLGRKSS